METANRLETAALPPGTEVGLWRVVARRGCGNYGAVYRAVRIGREAEGPVALKVAFSPGDPRFAREVELLSRVRHASVPRFEGSGLLQRPSGASYPYVAMQWVEGTPLYEWSEQHVPSSRQVLQWLAQLARALEATHAAGGVHRDVKGGNVLVRREDGRLFLTDFGAGHYQGADPLTGKELPPGSPAYRPPEAWLPTATGEHHSPGPADDVFALGVMGYRIVVGRYPPSTHYADEASYVWHETRVGAHAPRAFNERCCSELSALLLRMLSVSPEARGSAGELAEALEDAARRAGPEADSPLWAQVAPWLAQGRSAPELVPPPAPVPPAAPSPRGNSWPLVLALGLGVVLGYGSGWLQLSERGRAELGAATPSLAMDGGSAAVSDMAVEYSRKPVIEQPAHERIGWELPPKPLPGQRLPDAEGLCSRTFELIINGGCWLRIHVDDPEECKKQGYEYKGACYLPVMRLPRPPVSSSSSERARP